MPYDSNFNDVSLLLHCDGSDASTTFTDNSPLAHTVTAVGNAQIDTAQSKWGGAAGLFDGTGDYLTVPYHADLHLSSTDFTIEFWCRSAASTRTTYLISFGTSGGTRGWDLTTTSGGYLQFSAFNDAGTQAFFTQSSGPGVADGAATWYHVAITREGDTWRLFIDGTQRGSMTSSHVIRAAASGPSYRLVVAAYPSGAAAWNGWVDDIRITAGVARYTSNFTAPTEAFPDSGPPNEGYIAVDGPLGSPALLATHLAGSIAVDGPLGAPALLGAQQHGYLAVDGPLGDPALLASIRNGFLSVDGPLGAPALLGAQQRGYLAVDGPLGAPALVAHQQFGSITVDGPLGAPALLANVTTAGQMAVDGPLGAPALLAWVDFTGRIAPSSALRYVMDLQTPGGTVRVPIGSWQATLQTDASCYVQCVVPAVTDWADQIAVATEFSISRVATLVDGATVEYEMARSPLQTVQYAQGPTNHTATLSGYPDALTADADPPALFDRTLANVRSVYNGNDGSIRVRCAVDWLLRPGHRAYYDDVPIIVDFINYYVPGVDQYMDVGARA